MTYKMFTSETRVSHRPVGERENGAQGMLTKRMAAAQLRLLLVFPFELFADAVEQLHVALLRVLFQRRDERVRHGARSLATNLSVGTVS